MKNKIRGILDRLTGGGNAAPDELTRLQRSVRNIVELFRYTGILLIREHAPQMAAALAYRTIFSLVPVIVLSLVFLRAFLGEQGIRQQLDQLMEWMALDEIVIVQDEVLAQGDESPNSSGEAEIPESGANVRDADLESQPVTLAAYLGEFVDNAVTRISGINFGAITVVGVLVFIYAALSLLIQVEGAFNRICHASEGRRFLSRVTNYWTLLTLGTLLIFVSIAVGSNVGAVSQSWLGWASDPIRLFTRFGATWLVLLFAYVGMPNARVSLRTAAVGAVVAAILWELGKSGLAWFVRNAIEGQVAVYGSLAAIPLFLFWVYVTWLIVLLGLQIAVVLQSAGRGAPVREARFKERPLVDGAMGVIAIRAVGGRFQRGEATTMEELAEETGLPEAVLTSLMIEGEEAGIIRRVETKSAETAFSLARPADTIAIESIIRAFESLTVDPNSRDSSIALRSLRDSQLRGLDGKSLADLFESFGSSSAGSPDRPSREEMTG